MPAPTPMPAPAPQLDGLALLQGILANPQFQQTLQSARRWVAAAAHRDLPVPVPMQPQYQQPVSIPLGAVMNAIAQLAGRSMTELNAGTREDEPEVPGYLVDEQGEYVVDPANAEDRAALVAHLFRAERTGRGGTGGAGHATKAGQRLVRDGLSRRRGPRRPVSSL